MPKKIRELKSMLLQAGFELEKKRGASHFGKSIEQTNENTRVSKHN